MTKEVQKTAAPGAPSLAAPDAKWKEVVYKAFGCEDTVTLTIEMVRRQIANPSRSGKLPTDKECINFLMMCKAKQLNPWEGDAFLVGYDGQDGTTFTQITAHQAFLKRAEANKDYDGMESGVIVRIKDGEITDRVGDFLTDDDVLLGGWARIHLKNRKFPVEKRVKVQTFERQTKIWRENRAGMICKCAEADALRTAFPTTIGGLYLREEVEVLPPQHEAQPPTPKALFPPAKAQDAPKQPEPDPTPSQPPRDAPSGQPEATATVTEPPPNEEEQRKTLIAEIEPLYEKAKAPKIKQVMDTLKIKWQDGEAWETRPISDLIAMKSLLKC